MSLLSLWPLWVTLALLVVASGIAAIFRLPHDAQSAAYKEAYKEGEEEAEMISADSADRLLRHKV